MCKRRNMQSGCPERAGRPNREAFGLRSGGNSIGQDARLARVTHNCSVGESPLPWEKCFREVGRVPPRLYRPLGGQALPKSPNLRGFCGAYGVRSWRARGSTSPTRSSSKISLLVGVRGRPKSTHCRESPNTTGRNQTSTRPGGVFGRARAVRPSEAPVARSSHSNTGNPGGRVSL